MWLFAILGKDRFIESNPHIEMEEKKKIEVILSIFVLIVVGTGVLFSLGLLKLPFKNIFTTPPKEIEPDAHLMTVQDAHSVAFSRAREWKSDAVLADTKSTEGKTGPNGRSDNWEFLFVSNTAKGKGFKVSITDGVVGSAEELPYVGVGGELSEHIISAKEAIAKVHEINGYESEEVIAVELLYDPKGFWYWGVKTSKGTVSVRAAK